MTVDQLRSRWGKDLSLYYNYSEEDKLIVITRTLAYLENDTLTRDMFSSIKSVVSYQKKNPPNPDKMMELLYEAYPESLGPWDYPSDGSDVEEGSDEDEVSENEEDQKDEKEHDTIHDESMQQAQRHLEQLIMDNDHEDPNPVGKKTRSVATKDVKRKDVEKSPELSTSTEIVVAPKETRSPVRDPKEKEAKLKVAEKQVASNDEDSSQRPPIDQATLEAMAVKIEDLHYWQIYTKQYIENNSEFQLNQDVDVKTISIRLTAVEEAIKALSETLKFAPTEQRTPSEKIGKSRTYVKIIKVGDSNDVDEVPTNSQGLLPQSTVKALYEGTSAIKYRVTATSKSWRTLLLEEDLYHPPEDGWGDRIYHCTIPQGLVWKNEAPLIKNGPPLSRAPGTASTLDASAYASESLASPFPPTSLSQALPYPPTSLSQALPYPPTSLSMPPSSLPMFSSTTANSLPVINVNPAFLTGLPGIPLLGQQQQQSFPAELRKFYR